MSGLVVDIDDLPRATGSVKNLQIRTPAPADLGTEVIGVPEGSDLALDVTLTSMDDGVLARSLPSGTPMTSVPRSAGAGVRICRFLTEPAARGRSTISTTSPDMGSSTTG